MITVRLATLADTLAVTQIHRSHVSRWERLTADGTAIQIDYESLSPYERWQHGGPWLSIETCAIHLNRLLAGSGIALVAELDGRVLATAEVYESFEPPPFGHHLELSVIIAHADHMQHGLGSALMDYIIEMARLMKCERLMVSDAETPEFYEKHGFRRTHTGHGVRIATGAGRVFYQSTDLTERNAAQVRGWYLSLGRFRSSRQEWDKLFPQDWAAGIPELLSASTAHIKLTVTGSQFAILFAREADESDAQPGDVHIICWTARPLTTQMLTAIRDWAHRQGYRTLTSFMLDTDLALLGTEGHATSYTQTIYEFALTS